MSREKNNITIKIFALIIAMILWSYVMDKENPEIEKPIKNVNVVLTNTSALERQNLVVMEPKEFTVSVRVSGKKNDLANVTSKNIVAYVDLSGYVEGQVKVPVTVDLKDASNVKIITHEPKEILFTFDKLITDKKTVTIETSGELPDDYILGDIVSKPQSILLKGPRTWVNEVTNVVAIIDISGKTMTFNDSVPLKLLDQKGNDVRGVDKEPGLIDVTIPIYKTNSIPIELITENELPENFAITNITILPSALSIKGNKEDVNLSKINTKPIDINSLLDRNTIEVELDLPENIELLNPSERVIIHYNIEETIVKDYNISIKDMNILNLKEGLSISSGDLENIVQISLKGFKSILDKITEEDLNLELDLSNLEEGRHTVDLKIPNIQGIVVEDIRPEPIVINLIKN